MASQSIQSSSITSAPKELTSNDLRVLCNVLNDVAPKSYELGLQLGLREANLDIIMKNNKDDCQAQLRKIISERLKQDSPLTWHDIVTALRSPSVNHPDLVRHIESWYVSPLELQQHPASDSQQYLPLGGECPIYLWETLFSNEMGPPHGENYQPPTQMMDETPVWGRPDEDHFQSPSLMSGPWGRQSQSRPSDRRHYRSQSSVRGAPDRGHYRSQSPVRVPLDRWHMSSVRELSDRGHYRSQSPVRELSDRGHYRSQSPVRELTDRGYYRSQSSVRVPLDRWHMSPVRELSDRGHYRSQSPVRGPSDKGHYRSQSPVRRPSDRRQYRPQSPVRGSSDRGHYRSWSPVRGHYRSWSPVRGPSNTGHNRSQSPVKGPSDRRRNRSQSPVKGPSDRRRNRSLSWPSNKEQSWPPARRQSDERIYRFQSVTKRPPDYPSPSPMRGSKYKAAQVSPHMYSNSLYQTAHPNALSYPATRHMLSPTTRYLQKGSSVVGGPSNGRYQSQPPVFEPSGSRHYPFHSTEWESPHMDDWGSPNMHSPQQRAHSNTPYASRPYPTITHTSAPTTRPLLEGVLGGQWDNQSYTSHSQPQISHTQSERNSSMDCCPPPPKRFNLYSEMPFTESSTASHFVKSAHHRSPMDTFVNFIKVTYKQCEVEKNLNVLKWPPTPSKVFINLACIDWESVVSKEEADEYTRAMVEDGNVDVIMKKKRNIDFSDIVRDLPPVAALEKVVLVEGAPGVGKSTFAWEFCRRWERGEIAHQYQLVLLLRLRDERMSRAKSLRDLIYHSSENVCQGVVEELESTFGVNTLIILEGFDELSDSQREDPSIFLQLILGQLLLHATIMITSRPWATGALLVQFRHRIFLHVEILGFTEKNITKYVTSVFTEEGKKTASAIDQSVGGPDEVSEEVQKNIDDVMAYIGKYPQIKACMYIPLNAAIVVSIYRESMKSKWVLPTTLTELYQALTQILLLRYLRGHAKYSHQKWSVESFEDLPGEVYSQLLVISKRAYDGVCREGGKSVQLIFPDIPDDFETLGLMQSVSQLFMCGQKTSHNFLHLTVQEFLAAFLISTKSPAEQLKDFKRHEDGRLRVVLRFVAGLTKLNKVTPDELRSLPGEPTVKQSDKHQTPYCNPMRPDVCVSPHHTNWLFEAQNSELLQSLVHNHTASFTFTRGMLPLEYYSVGYCIAHSNSKWSLTFNEDTEKEKLHMLVSGAKTCNSDYRVALKTTSMKLKNMHILVNGFSSNMEELYYLKIPDNCNSLSLPPLSTLHILELQIDDKKLPFNIMFCDLSFSSLQALIISSSREGTTLGAKTCKSISELLSSTTSLKEFHLSPNLKSPAFSPHVGREEMGIIIKALNDNTALPLECLDIDCKCTFTVSAARFLAQFIRRITTLQYLKIHFDTLEDVDIFAKGLSDNIALPLKSLDIDCKCTFTTTSTRSLIQFITRNTTLQYIRLCRVTFSAQRLIELTEAIHNCSRLQEKKLEKLTFRVECSEDVVNLGHMIKEHPDMLKSITDWDGVTNVHSSSIQLDDKKKASIVRLGLGCSQDTSLSLVSMNISDARVEDLAQALCHTSTLEKLDIDCECTFTTTATRSLVQFITRSTKLHYIRICRMTFSAKGLTELTEAMLHCSTLQEKKFDKLILRVESPEDVDNLCHMTKDYPDMYKSITDWDGVTNIHPCSTGYNDVKKIWRVSLVRLVLGCQDKSIHLRGMNISDTVAVAIARALHHNSTLERLHLSKNNISDAGAVALAQALRRNSTLKELDLSGNDIGQEGTHQLVQALTVNTSIAGGGGLRLPRRCEKYATQCTQYTAVKNSCRIQFSDQLP